MLHPVYVYYDVNGNVSEWVVSDDDGYTPSERPGMVRVSIPRQTYDALPAHINAGGVAVPLDMNRACLPALLIADPIRGAKCKATCDALDAQLALTAKTASDAQASSLAAWNKLDPAVRQAAIDADALGTPFVMPVIISQ